MAHAHALDRRDLLKGGAAAAVLVGAGVIAPQRAQATEADAAQTWGVFDEEGMFTPSFLIAPAPFPRPTSRT